MSALTIILVLVSLSAALWFILKFVFRKHPWIGGLFAYQFAIPIYGYFKLMDSLDNINPLNKGETEEKNHIIHDFLLFIFPIILTYFVIYISIESIQEIKINLHNVEFDSETNILGILKSVLFSYLTIAYILLLSGAYFFLICVCIVSLSVVPFIGPLLSVFIMAIFLFFIFMVSWSPIVLVGHMYYFKKSKSIRNFILFFVVFFGVIGIIFSILSIPFSHPDVYFKIYNYLGPLSITEWVICFVVVGFSLLIVPMIYGSSASLPIELVGFLGGDFSEE